MVGTATIGACVVRAIALASPIADPPPIAIRPSAPSSAKRARARSASSAGTWRRTSPNVSAPSVGGQALGGGRLRAAVDDQPAARLELAGEPLEAAGAEHDAEPRLDVLEVHRGTSAATASASSARIACELGPEDAQVDLRAAGGEDLGALARALDRDPVVALRRGDQQRRAVEAPRAA